MFSLRKLTGLAAVAVTASALAIAGTGLEPNMSHRADNSAAAAVDHKPNAATMNNELMEVAVSPQYQWNAVAVSPDGRIFASFPRWLGDETISVGEVLKDGSIRAFPGGEWNTWHPKQPAENPGNRFVHVNAIYIDRANNLWVVDSAAPGFGKVVQGGTETGAG